MLPIPPPNVSNIFDISTDRELPTIPVTGGTSLLAEAVEISEPEDGSTVLKHPPPVDITEQPARVFTPLKDGLQLNSERSTPAHDRSQSFSFGQTVFHSLGSGSTSTPANDSVKTKAKHNRNRALSDTVFQNMIHTPSGTSTPQEGKLPEADINDTSTALVVMGSPEKEKDPFGAHATTYYTPGTMLPPSPPMSTHTRKASREEDIIWSLRTQLALQSELCAQFELDLGARDELVQTLSGRLADTERECERRKSVVRNWRKRVAELEKCVRGLEDEIDRSREESMDRSVMDEASGEALRMLHRRIGDLEREKSENEKRERQVREELEARIRELEKVKVELKQRDESERELQAGIRAAREEMDSMGMPLSPPRHSQIRTDDQREEMRNLLLKSEAHTMAQAAWEEERTALLEADGAMRQEQVDLQNQITDTREEILRKEQEIAFLRSELEAQWRHTEKSSEEIEAMKAEKLLLEKDREELKVEVDALNERISTMELEYNDSGNRKDEIEKDLEEAWRLKEEAEQQREEVGHLIFSWRHSELTIVTPAGSTPPCRRGTRRRTYSCPAGARRPCHRAHSRTPLRSRGP